MIRNALQYLMKTRPRSCLEDNAAQMDKSVLIAFDPILAFETWFQRKVRVRKI